jgi:hypothetical protein
MNKYWEAFIDLETSREPPISENKRRDLYKRALRFVTDYPPAIARLWTNYERDYGTLDSLVECYDTCEVSLRIRTESVFLKLVLIFTTLSTFFVNFLVSSKEVCVFSSCTSLVEWLCWKVNRGPLILGSDSCTVGLPPFQSN